MNWFTKKKKKDDGFTLIELIIVVAIIGFLMAIAIPRYATSRRVAAQSATKANLHQLATAIEVYYTENNATSYPTAAAGVQAALRPYYIPKAPKPPMGGTGVYYKYLSDQNGTYFAIYDPVTPAEGGDNSRYYIQTGGVIEETGNNSIPQGAGDLNW